MSRLVYNAIRTPDGTVLESLHRHDFKAYEDHNGETYIVDGGLDYERRSSGHMKPAEELSLYSDSPQEQVGKVVKWGNYGVKGDQPLEWKSLRDMRLDHLKACIDNVPNMDAVIRTCMLREIEWREE
tara:strand:- start:579 stop:959 length:381 start_codon:yes stop_codon:yes gene_type:complete